MADRLRELIDLVLASLDEPRTDGRALAGRASFSRDHGVAPRAFAASDRPVQLDAPNGIHFHAPAGLLIPGERASRERDVTDRLLAHHVDRVRELLTAAATLPPDALARPLRPGFVAVWFDGEEASAELMAQRLVGTFEVWVAAMAGQPQPAWRSAAGAGVSAELLEAFERAARAFVRIIAALRARGAWDDAFVDALCEPPQSFTYGGVVAHVLSYGAVRREMLAGVLAELGVRGLASGDPIEWEQGL